MKKKLLKVLEMSSKFAFYGLIAQLFLLNYLFAYEGNAQRIKSVKDVRISLSLSNASVEEIFQAIEKESSFEFFYDKNFINKKVKLDLQVADTPLSDVLLNLSEQTNLKFRQENQVIKVAKSNRNSKVEQLEIVIQGTNVSGKVTSMEDGQALPGVNVLVKGTSTGTITDVDGNYSIVVPDAGGVLVFSYIGFTPEEITVNGRSVIDVQMVADVQQLSEIVVIGYGAVKKSDLTGSVAIIGQQDLENRVTSSISSLMQGRAPGVDVTAGTVRIRGVGTMNNTNPLYVVDGFVGADLGTVAPNEIASIQVLKDASAIAIYGASGANGVIMITTKKAQAGAPKVELNAFTGWGNPSKTWDLLNASQYMDLVRDIELNGGTTAAELGAKTKIFNSDGTPNTYSLTDRTNWQDIMFQNSKTHEINAAVSGGTEKSLYRVSFTAREGDGLVVGPYWKGYKLGAKGDFKIGKIIKLDPAVHVQIWNNRQDGADIAGGIRMPSYSPLYDENALGGYAYVTTTDDLNDAVNPVAEINNTERWERGASFQATIGADINFTKDLVFRSQYLLKGNYWSNFSFQKPYQSGNLIFDRAEMVRNQGQGMTPMLENWITYNKAIAEHRFTVMAGNSILKGAWSNDFGVTSKGYVRNDIYRLDLGNEKNINNDNNWHEAKLSYFGRINYSFMDRYLLTANFRADASDRFAPANRWGYFPSVAVAWKINEESFFNIPAISQLKLRGSYGLAGNDRISQYMYFTSIHANPYYIFGGTRYQGATINRLASPVIKWEEAKNTSIGLDLGLFKGALMITADYFEKNTYDILFAVPQPPSLGMGNNGGGGNATVNAATTINKGVEFQVDFNKQSGDFKYQLQANVTYVDNEVTSLGSGEPYNAGSFGFYSTNRTEVGYPIGYYYGFKMDKVYKTQAEVNADNEAARSKALEEDPDLTEEELGEIYYNNAETKAGDIRWIDTDGDGVITDDDRTYLGSVIPKFNFGLTGSASYKGIDLYMAFTGVQGNKIFFGNTGYWLEGMIRPFNASTAVLNRWRSESQPGDGKMPRAVKTDPAKNLRMSDRFVYNGTYFRLGQLSIGYTLPQNLIESLSLSKVRIYGTGENLFTLTEYPGLNPEVGGDNTTRGRDEFGWPLPRTFYLGIQVEF